MRLDFRQEQTQKLILTPELRQAIKILQLPVMELISFIEQELTENPVLELYETDDNVESCEACKTGDDQEETFDSGWEEYFYDSSDLGLPASYAPVSEDIRPDHWLAAVPTMQEHLLAQLALSTPDDEERKIGSYLIGNIDDNGYLKVSAEEAAADCHAGVEAAERVLQVLQSFEPPGVAARDLQECLLLQAEQLENAHPLLRSIIESHLEEVGKGRLNRVASSLGADLLEVQAALDQLKTLEPKPGRHFSRQNDTRYVVPDIIVEKVEGEYIVLVNDPLGPRLSINRIYRTIIGDPQVEKGVRKFIETKIHAASWLVKNLEQRRLTLYRVAAAIVEMQKAFLDGGVKLLRPLHLRQVAEKVNLHESTISRATANKYIQTPRGVFEMKFFFAGGPEEKSGEGMSAAGIKKTLSELISDENTSNPLSDQKLVALLKERGVDISRRTVAKYRDEMGIPPTTRRKRY